VDSSQWSAPPRPSDAWSLVSLLRERSRSTPDRIFLRWTHEDPGVTYAEADRLCMRIATALQTRGIAPGDRVVLVMHNSISHALTWLALGYLGAIDAAINPQYFGDLLAHQISLVRPRAIIVDEEFSETVLASPTVAALDRSLVLVSSSSTRGRLPDFVPVGLEPLDALILPQPHEAETIMYTSGTTGPSKAVLMSHAQLYFYSWQTVALHRMTADDVYLAPYPLFHASGRVHGIGAALVSGGTCVLYDRFSASSFAERVALSRATVTHFLGSMMQLIVELPVSDFEASTRLRSVMALPTPVEASAEFRRRYGVENIAEAIGMTETAWPVMSPYATERPRGAAGMVVEDWYDVQVADPATDLELAAGEVGELQVRPRHPWILALGYEGTPQATVEAWRNLWFHTGDLVRRDDDGWLYFVDRLKDSIRRRGENISAHEVEEAIRATPGVRDAAAVAYRVPGESNDEEIVAFLILDSDRTDSDRLDHDLDLDLDLDVDELRTALVSRLPAFAVPKYFRVLRELPTTPSGKIQKHVLRELGVEGTWTL
jgi:crotonobetaine/carnitine-CoA ligase